MKIVLTGAELFHEDGRTGKTKLTVAFVILATRQKNSSINCNKSRYWTIGMLFPIGAGILSSFVTASRPHSADHSPLLTVKDFWVKYRKYFTHSLLQKTKQALKLRLLFQVALFLQFHRTTSALLEEVSNWGESRPTFDAEGLKINKTEESKNNSEIQDYNNVLSENTVSSMAQVNSPDDLYNHYK